MFSALLYLQYHSVTNRLLRQVTRLKRPKYLLFAGVGALYLYFYFFRYAFHFRPGRSAPGTASPQDLVLLELVGGLVLFILVFFAWVIPHQRAALAFSEAEVAFLFPAPVTRRGLVHFKLLRSQSAILFTILLLTLISNRFGGAAWIHALGWWFILSNLNLHFLGSSFARTMLLDRGITNWQRRLVILGLVALAFVSIVIWARRTMPAFQPRELDDLEALKRYIEQILTTGPALFLYPFRLVVRPYLASNPHAFLLAALPALALMLAQYLWVIRSDVSFEEASVDAARRIAEKVAAVRAGNWQASGKAAKSKRAPFLLQPIGPRPVALLWKNLISAGQAFTLRLWILILATTGGASVGLGQTFGRAGWASALGMVAAMLILWSILLGPQFLRQDFRQDLQFADILKMYPMPGWQIALGELLAPAVILTVVQWVLLIIGVGLLSQNGEVFPSQLVQGVGAGAALVLPILNFITLLIPNAAVLLLPTWFQGSRGGPQGIEATGQRLIFMFGQVLAFMVVLLPAAGLFLLTMFLLKSVLALGWTILLASAFAACVLSVEAAFGVLFLGWLFDRLDLSSENVS